MRRLAQGWEVEASSSVSSAPTCPLPTPSRVPRGRGPHHEAGSLPWPGGAPQQAGCVPGLSQRLVPYPPGAIQSLLAWPGVSHPSPDEAGSLGPLEGRVVSTALVATAAHPEPRQASGSAPTCPHLPQAGSEHHASPESVQTQC